MASLIYMTLNFHMHMKEEKDQEATVLAPLPSKSPSLTDTQSINDVTCNTEERVGKKKEEDVEEGEEDEIDANQGGVVSLTFDRYSPYDLSLFDKYFDGTQSI